MLGIWYDKELQTVGVSIATAEIWLPKCYIGVRERVWEMYREMLYSFEFKVQPAEA